jgi:hypothetical protein
MSDNAAHYRDYIFRGLSQNINYRDLFLAGISQNINYRDYILAEISQNINYRDSFLPLISQNRYEQSKNWRLVSLLTSPCRLINHCS